MKTEAAIFLFLINMVLLYTEYFVRMKWDKISHFWRYFGSVEVIVIQKGTICGNILWNGGLSGDEEFIPVFEVSLSCGSSLSLLNQAGLHDW